MSDRTPEDFAQLPGDWGDLEGLFAQLGSAFDLASLADDHPDVVRRLEHADPLRTSALFGALLMRPDLMCNGTRLEALVHLALHAGRKSNPPTAELASTCFNLLGRGRAGHVEDPAEDVFVGLITSPRGPFRILEGVWEGATFHLQRIVNIAETMPATASYDDLRDAIYGLLAISDLACERAGLQRHQAGGAYPADKLPRAALRNLDQLTHPTTFDLDDLSATGVSLDHLAPFVFDPDDRSALLERPLGATRLEQHPLAFHNDRIHLLLPTAVSLAIRRLVLDALTAGGARNAMIAGLALEYAATFKQASILGEGPGADVEFKWTEAGCYAGVARAIDRGRHLNILFLLDTLDDFEETGFSGVNPAVPGGADMIDRFIDHARDMAQEDPEFREGVTLLVGCGLGRGLGFDLNPNTRPDWRIEMIGAHDLLTLSQTQDFSARAFWKLLDARDAAERAGLTLQNVNGLLNLAAWVRSLTGHLVPEASLPDDFITADAAAFVAIEQNKLLDLRAEVLEVRDPHMLRDWTGAWRAVARRGASIFAEDRGQPLYQVSRDGPAVFVTDRRQWWCETNTPPETARHIRRETLRTATVWLSRAAPVLDLAFPALPPGGLVWRITYDVNPLAIRAGAPAASYADALADIRLQFDDDSRCIGLTVGATWVQSQLNIDNDAERALVAALVTGVASLAGQPLDETSREALTDRIVPNARARQQHALPPSSHRDHVAPSIPRHVVVIDPLDDASSRLGLGWRVRERSSGAWIRGKAETTGFLNASVALLQDELAAELRRYGREPFLRALLLNHEAAAVDRDHWTRTTAAMMALHDDPVATRRDIQAHEFKLNAVFQMSRVLAEFAVCECPNDGPAPGAIDLSRLMAKAAMIFNLGGYSDAIRRDVMAPELRVTPLGDIHANWGFMDAIIEPFAREVADGRIATAETAYGRRPAPVDDRASLDDELDPEFVAAFREQMGVTPNAYRLFVEYLEDLSFVEGSAVIVRERSALFPVQTDLGSLDDETASRLIDGLTLQPRQAWRETPAGFDDRDRHPWRFRRRLSVLRKPLLQLDQTADPRLVFAPALVREALVYTLHGYVSGDFPGYQLSPAMTAWAGRRADLRGRVLAEETGEALKAAGWRTVVDHKVTRLLGRGFDRDYGDVDVLAWRDDGRVLIIECKDLQFKKTLSDMSEQLADFRGRTDSNGKRDYLRLHLDRVDLLRNHVGALEKFIGQPITMPPESHLVFRNPVPITYALREMTEAVRVTVFSAVGEL